MARVLEFSVNEEGKYRDLGNLKVLVQIQVPQPPKVDPQEQTVPEGFCWLTRQGDCALEHDIFRLNRF